MSVSPNCYPIVSGETFQVALTPNGKQKKRVIYGISEKNRIVLVGKTGQTLAKRVSWYQCMLNKVVQDQNADVPNRRLFSAMAERPGDFHFSVLEVAQARVPLGKLESVAIRKYDTVENGYNSNYGGGGGSAISSPSCKSKKRKYVAIDANEYTPTKNYPVAENEEGRVVPLWSPDAKKKSSVIYRIRQISTGKCYIGKTETTVAERFSKHFFLVNTEKQKPELYRLIQSNPEDFDTGILYKCNPGDDIDAIEKQFIKRHRAEGLSFNKNNGGGGSHATAKRLFV